MKDLKDRRLAFGILLIGALGTAAVAAENDGGYGARLATGYETNPLRISDDGPNGLFTDLLLDGHVRRAWDSGVELFANADAWQRFYESGTADADYAGGSVRTGAAFSPTRRLSVTAGGFYSLYRATYTDRATGEVFEISAPPSASISSVAIPDRLDYDGRGLFLCCRVRPRTRRPPV